MTVPLSTCPAGSQVGMVADIAGGNTYMAFDNLRVTASATPGGVASAAVPVNAPLALLGAVLGLGWLGARDCGAEVARGLARASAHAGAAFVRYRANSKE